MPDAFDIDQAEEPEIREVETTVDHVTGLAIRHCEGQRGFLNWQAGQMISERHYMPVSASSSFYDWQTVSVFHLLGYGWTRSEAIEMALKNPNARNGR